MAYQVPSVKPLWSPKLNGTSPEVTSVPGLLGIDHVGITVPDVAAASAWFGDVLGGANPLTFGPFADPTGDFMHQLVDVDPRAVVDEIRMIRTGNGPGRAALRRAPDQERAFVEELDWGATIAFYVRNIDVRPSSTWCKRGSGSGSAVRRHGGSGRRQTINYVRTPFGDRHRADQLPARDGVSGVRRGSPLGTRAQPPLTQRL
jgi:catechol 2,3-dioxygenase-like lactoylglutathione lyase family enzyme